MVLGFHYHIPAYSKNGKICTMSLQGLFIDSLAPYWDKIIVFLHSPVQAEIDFMDYEIQSENVILVQLMPHVSIIKRLLLAKRTAKKFEEYASQLDLLLLRAPTPMLPFIVKAVSKKTKYAYLNVGNWLDYMEEAKNLSLKERALKKYYKWNEGKEIHYAKDALVFANSTVMYEVYKPIAKRALPIKTTTLKKSDIVRRDDTCQNNVYEILFAGRIAEQKGLIEITEALGRLNKEGIVCRFNLVGWTDRNDNTDEKIMEIATKWGIGDKVIFHGKKKVGDELFDFYRKADIYVMASTAEGFPRTIWEALASSTPVVAAPVGAIPHYLKDNHDALFVRPRNAEDVYEKVKALIQDGALRRQLIKNGLETVSDVTLEIQAERMCNEMKNYLAQNN
jgi:glycosyltransferase involved in cell wall biosynthesis